MNQLAREVIEQVLSRWREIRDGFVDGTWGVNYPGIPVATRLELIRKSS
jgi:hypothetical protein